MAQEEATPGDKPVEEQAREQTGQKQIRLRVDERSCEQSGAEPRRG